MGDRRKKDFLTNAFEDAGKAISGVVRDIGEIPVIKDIGKAINSQQIKKDFDAVGGEIDKVTGAVTNALKTTKERNKGILDMGNTPVREDGPETGQVASYIAQTDHIYVKIIKALYGTPTDIDDYKLSRLGDQAVRAWVNETTEHVIICIQGTSISTDKGLSNILDDVTLATQGGCNLAAVSTATLVLKDILARGFTNITACGHSLGGAAAFCLGEKYPEITCVGFNAAAPITSPRETPPNGRAYHIIGDLISSHIGGAVTRIYLVESGTEYVQTKTQLQLDGVIWDDVGYYHGIARFFDRGRQYRIESAQFEQQSLENFVFKDTLLAKAVGVLGAATSQKLNVFKIVQELVCAHPIPGSEPARGCLEKGTEMGFTIAGTAIGGAIGAVAGLVSTAGVATVPGVLAGAGAGYALTAGEKGLWDFIPGVPEAIAQATQGIAAANQGLTTAQGVNVTMANDKIVRDTPGGPVDRLVKRVRVQ